MSPQVYKVASGIAIVVILTIFFVGLSQMRLSDCEERRLEIIEAANAARSEDSKLWRDTHIAYSPGELLKKLADPAGYEEQLIAKLKEQKAKILQPTIVQEILINERVYSSADHVSVDTKDTNSLRSQGVLDSPVQEADIDGDADDRQGNQTQREVQLK